jgi:pilus assembly protein Flp/PilA
MFAYLRKLIRTDRDRGASAVEYGLLVAAIAAIIVAAAFALGGTMNQVFQDTNDEITNSIAVP